MINTVFSLTVNWLNLPAMASLRLAAGLATCSTGRGGQTCPLSQFPFRRKLSCSCVSLSSAKTSSAFDHRDDDWRYGSDW
jgi:hypothetical protein